MSDLDVSVWDGLSDHEAEARHARVTALRVATASVWPFLAQASDREDFANRLELTRERLQTTAAQHGADDVLPLVEASYCNDFETMLQVRQASQQKVADTPHPYGRQLTCKNCGGDIEYHGPGHGWIDRGGNKTCAGSGHGRWDPETGADIPMPHTPHVPYDPDQWPTQSGPPGRAYASLNKESVLIPGHQLNSSQRDKVKSAFMHRWTSDNPHRTRAYGPCPSCDIKNPTVNTESSAGHNHPTIPLSTDNEWLASHAFHFTQKGELHRQRNYAEPYYGDRKEGAKAGDAGPKVAAGPSLDSRVAPAPEGYQDLLDHVIHAHAGTLDPTQVPEEHLRAIHDWSLHPGHSHTHQGSGEMWSGSLNRFVSNRKTDGLSFEADKAPYYVNKKGDDYVVVNKDGEVKGTHPTKAKADAQERAMYANIPDAADKAEKAHGKPRPKTKSSAWDPTVSSRLESLYNRGFEFEGALECPACPETFFNETERLSHMASHREASTWDQHGQVADYFTKRKPGPYAEHEDAPPDVLKRLDPDEYDAWQSSRHKTKTSAQAAPKRGPLQRIRQVVAERNPTKKPCPYCGKLIDVKRMAHHIEEDHPHQAVPLDVEGEGKKEKGHKHEGAAPSPTGLTGESDPQDDTPDLDTQNQDPSLNRQAAIEKMAMDLYEANPGLSEPQRIHIASETIRRFPGLVSQARGGADYVDGETLSGCPQCGREALNAQTGTCHNCGYVQKPGA